MEKFLIKFLLAFLGKVTKLAKPKMREGAGPGKLEERLKAKLKKEGWL